MSQSQPDPAPRATEFLAEPVTHVASACELCGGAVLDRHCKIVCLTCGFIRDCSDP